MNADTLLTPTEAQSRGYQPLTLGYSLTSSEEMGMLDNVEEDMLRGGIDHAMVDIGDQQVEVWRKPSRTLVPEPLENPELN
jgi:hypothetical protein